MSCSAQLMWKTKLVQISRIKVTAHAGCTLLQIKVNLTNRTWRLTIVNVSV